MTYQPKRQFIVLFDIFCGVLLLRLIDVSNHAGIQRLKPHQNATGSLSCTQKDRLFSKHFEMNINNQNNN